MLHPRLQGKLLFFALLLMPTSARSNYQILANFNGSNGATPQAGVIMDSSGDLYGTTTEGGSANLGTIFQLSPGGTITTLINFNGPNGAEPLLAGLIMDKSGNLFGTTFYGGTAFPGDGTVFKISPNDTLNTLIKFNGSNAANPVAGVIMDSNGNLYGTTLGGGSATEGTAFKLSPDGTLTTLVNFGGSNGANPYAGLLMDSNGNLYGTTLQGGASNEGTVFKLSPDGTLKTLISFNGSNGAYPYANLLMDSSGNLFGTTPYGGLSNEGTVFKLSPDGTITTLHNFAGGSKDGAQPVANLFMDNGGNLYGTTSYGGSLNDGTVYELTGVTSVVPEPSKLLLFGQGVIGLLGLVWSGRRTLSQIR